MADCGQASISVAVRVRPFTIQEAAQLQRTEGGTLFLGDGSLAGLPAPKLHQRGLRSVIRIMDDRCLVFDPPEDNPVQKFSRSILPTTKKVKDQVFAFDRVFDENTTQSDVYQGTTKNLLDSVLDGYNATVLAYGATGCGKTHTITGTAQHPGIIFMTMRELFEKIEERSQEKRTEVSLSYLEIYNETIRDLLVPGGSKQGLMLREDSHHAVTVAGLSSHYPKDVQEVMDMIVQGNGYRTVSPTEANATSSRSHAVLQINVAQKDRNADVEEPHTMATLSIIDLAGSERASVTKNRGERLTEGANINKSLLALGSCINALCDRRQRAHVPYRNSKLTRLLKFSLGGNCKTVMIVCVSPSSAHFDETQNTLRYANRAKNIQTRVTRNVFNVNRHVKDFLVKIDEQMAYINELKAQLKDAEKISLAKIRKQGQKRAEVVREAEQRLQVAYDNSAPDRQKHLVCLKKLVAFDRHAELLTQCVSVLNSIDQKLESDSPSDGDKGEIRRIAQSSIVDIEKFKERSTQRLRNITWERPIDTALNHNLIQLQGIEGADSGEGTADIMALQSRASLLKDCFYREASDEVLAQQKAFDNTIAKNLLTNRTDIPASLSGILDADELKIINQGMFILGQTLRTVYGTSCQIAEPGEVVSSDHIVYPPSLKGTPKRKKTLATYVKPIIPPALSSVQNEHVFASPAKPSPRRRKVPGAARKTVSFMPIRKTKSRGVRWRDNETEEGTLADFEKTPQKQDDSEEEQAILAETSSLPAPDLASKSMEMAEESPSSTRGSAEDFKPAVTKSSRFQPGFLSRAGQTATAHLASSLMIPPKRSNDKIRGLPLPSTTSALRTLENDNIRSSSPQSTLYSKSSPSVDRAGLHSVDENTPLQHPNVSEVSSDSESSFSDLQALRNALYVAKREKGRRASYLTRPMAPGVRAGGMARCLSNEHPPIRASLAGPLASSTNGISRHRRGSSERRSLSAIASPNILKAGQTLKPEQSLRWNDNRRQSKLEALKLSPVSAGAGMRVAAIGTGVGSTASKSE